MLARISNAEEFVYPIPEDRTGKPALPRPPVAKRRRLLVHQTCPIYPLPRRLAEKIIASLAKFP